MSSLLAMLLSAAGDVAQGTVALSSLTASAEAFDPSTATASYSLTSAGVRTASGLSNANWINPAMGMGDFEVLATVQSGTLSSGPTGSYLPLSTTRTWTRQRSGVGRSACIIRIQVRRISDAAQVADVTITLQATVVADVTITLQATVSIP